MIYAIKILEKSIQEHSTEILRLEEIEYELSSDDFFAKEEIKERKYYIAIADSNCYIEYCE